MNRIRNIRIYVRNKQKYNPSTFSNDLQHVDIADFAGTTVGFIKEECKRNNAAKIDDLYFNNEPLADDRSVAHYNLGDGTILETTSNPLWVACMNIKIVEINRERDAHPDDKGVQKWTEKSYIRKRTILSVLLNSKSEFPRQPPHLPTVELLVNYLKTLGKKGTEMNPFYTQRDLKQMYDEYNRIDIHQPDPIGSFLTRHSARLELGFDDQGGAPQIGPRKPAGKKTSVKAKATPARTRKSSGPKKTAKQDMVCEDCEVSSAEVYCPDCQGAEDKTGVCLCMMCADKLHTGALKRNHNVRDISAAPRAPKQYTPHPYRSPFAILIGMYSGLLATPPVLSLSEDDIKLRSQPFTDTDLQDKQTGTYVGGFDCLENTLLKKGFVQKEAADRHTYALTESGQKLAEQLYLFHAAVTSFRAANRVPDVPVQHVHTQCGTRRLYLVIDEKERDLNRLRNIARIHGIPTLIRTLPVGDYMWILSPPLAAPDAEYDANNKAGEVVLPFIVERKSWNDYFNSWRGSRFKRQIKNMKASGIRNCFYLVEGSVKNLRFITPDQQQKLKDELEALLCEEGFYVNYTSSWSKSAQWLCWMTSLISQAYRLGAFKEMMMPFPDIQRNITAKNRNPEADVRKKGRTHMWLWQDFIQAITSDSSGEQSFSKTCEDNFGSASISADPNQLLVIEGLEAYNKQRSSLLNRCLESVVNLTQDHLHDKVMSQLKPDTENLLHYDVFSHWQLSIQVHYGVYVVRTESTEDTARIQAHFAQGAEGHQEVHYVRSQQLVLQTNVKGDNPVGLQAPAVAEVPPGVEDGAIQEDYAPDSQTELDMIHRAMEESRMELEALKDKRSSYSAGPSCTHVAMSTTGNGASIHNEDVISLVDSQEDGLGAPGIDLVPSSINVSGSSLEDPVVLEDSQSQEEPLPHDSLIGDIPCITLIDSQEESQLPEFDFVSSVSRNTTETEVKHSVNHTGGKEIDLDLDTLDEEEQMKLAMNKSLCESSLGTTMDSDRDIQLVCDHNANKVLVEPSRSKPECKSVPPKTPTKRRHQPDYDLPSTKVPKMDVFPEGSKIQQVIPVTILKDSSRKAAQSTDLKDTSFFSVGSESVKCEKTFTDEEFAKQLKEKFDQEYEESSQSLPEETSRSLRSKREGKSPSRLDTSTSSDIDHENIVLHKIRKTSEPSLTMSAEYDDVSSSSKENHGLSGRSRESSEIISSQSVKSCDSRTEDARFSIRRENHLEVDELSADSSRSLTHIKTESDSEKDSPGHRNSEVGDTGAKDVKMLTVPVSEPERMPTEGADVNDSLPQDYDDIDSVASQSILGSVVSDVAQEVPVELSCPDLSLDHTEDMTKSDIIENTHKCCEDTVRNCKQFTNIGAQMFVNPVNSNKCVFSSNSHESESLNPPPKIKTESVMSKEEDSQPVVKTETLTDEEFARQLQEELDRESRTESAPQSCEPKSLRSREIKPISIKKEIPWQPVQSLTSTVQEDEDFARSLQIEESGFQGESPSSSFQLDSCDRDEEFARRLLLYEESKVKTSKTDMSNTESDAEFARKLHIQLSGSEVSTHVTSRRESLDYDAELARSIQEEEDKKMSVPDLSKDEEMAKRMQLEEQTTLPVDEDSEYAKKIQMEEDMLDKQTSLPVVSFDEDSEYAKKIQMEEDMLSKSSSGKVSGTSSSFPTDSVFDVKDFDCRSSSGISSNSSPQFDRLPRKPIKQDKTERIIVNQLAQYRESQKQKFSTATGSWSQNKHTGSSTFSSPSQKPVTYTPVHRPVTPQRALSSDVSQKPVLYTPVHKPVTSHRVPSATVSSPWQQAEGSRTPPKPVIPVGRVAPTASSTSSTFKGLGNRATDIDNRVKVEGIKNEKDDDVIDITDSQEKKEEQDSPSKTMVVKNVRCGNCKELGHPRTYPQCPYFYRQSEVDRRDAKAKENLKRREEKATENEETLALLSNSERILKKRKESMLAQLKAEAEKVEEEFTDQIRQLNRVVKKREKRTNKKK